MIQTFKSNVNLNLAPVDFISVTLNIQCISLLNFIEYRLPGLIFLSAVSIIINIRTLWDSGKYTTDWYSWLGVCLSRFEKDDLIAISNEVTFNYGCRLYRGIINEVQKIEISTNIICGYHIAPKVISTPKLWSTRLLRRISKSVLDIFNWWWLSIMGYRFQETELLSICELQRLEEWMDHSISIGCLLAEIRLRLEVFRSRDIYICYLSEKNKDA